MSRTRSSLPIVAIAIVAVVMACNTKDQRNDTLVARDSATERSLAGTAGTARVGAKPPKLVKRPGADPAAWKAYRDAIRLRAKSDTTTERGCANAPGEHDGDCLLAITAVEDAQLVDTNDVDSLGVVIARIRNVGRDTEAVYGIAGKQTVYWVIYQRPDTSGAGRTGMRFVTQLVDSATGTALVRPNPPPPESPLAGVRGLAANEFPYRTCHPDTMARTGDNWATFKHCKAALLQHRLDSLKALPGADKSNAVQTEIRRVQPQLEKLRTSHNLPAWISCIQGCCTVEGP